MSHVFVVQEKNLNVAVELYRNKNSEKKITIKRSATDIITFFDFNIFSKFP